MYACFSTIGGIRLPPTEENSENKYIILNYTFQILNHNYIKRIIRILYIILIPVELES